ncbi:universal stress protein [Halorubrum halophilum]|uniref:universal stress protein n=1 Tax=Halorubrum halophilum TaxID=413816 RepID=UPI0006791DBC|nr:universal stress protein [Halorubrum halophilum]
MYEILLPITTDSARTIRQIAAVEDLPLQRDEVEVTPLYVFEELDSDLGGVVSTKEYSDVPETMSQATDRLTELGFEINPIIAEGDPKDLIVSIADERDVDHILVTGHRRSPAGKVLFGSVAQAVVINSEVPVTVVQTVDGDGEEQ